VKIEMAGASLAHRAGAQEKAAPKPPQDFDAATAAAWKKAGAEAGWMGTDPKNVSLKFARQPDGLTAAVPAFRFKKWQENLLAGSPAPAVPFGLHLVGKPVTDAGLKELAGLKSLQALNLGGTKVTDAGLKELAGLNALQKLNLEGTKVTDAGMKELAGLKTLQWLDLYNTKVTDAGLKDLAGLKSLQSLAVDGTEVTATGVAELQKALPTCEIYRGGSPSGDNHGENHRDRRRVLQEQRGPRGLGGLVSEAPGDAAGAVGRRRAEVATGPGRGQRPHRLDCREAGHQVVRAQ
jgi:hypothetical protein